MQASKTSWKHLPAPVEREPLGFEGFFTDAEADQLMLGLVPRDMEDKWFIYFEDGWLLFHRNWTGALIYAIRLGGSPAGVRVVDSWVSRNREQYRLKDTAYDRKLARFLIDAFLLKKSDAVFPTPPLATSTAAGVVQQSLIGRAFPESEQSDRAIWRVVLYVGGVAIIIALMIGLIL